MTSDGRAVETEKIRASTEGTSIFTCFSSSSEVVDLNEGMRSSLEGAAFASAKKAAIPASSSDTPPASRPDLGRPSAIEGTVGVRTALLGGSAEFPRPPSCSSVRTSNEVGGTMPVVEEREGQLQCKLASQTSVPRVTLQHKLGRWGV
eukprot:scaffold8936_cov61-Phaeocystis_antarctica.AAC.19